MCNIAAMFFLDNNNNNTLNFMYYDDNVKLSIIDF